MYISRVTPGLRGCVCRCVCVRAFGYVEGNHMDLLVVILHQCMMANRPWLRPLYESWLATICNAAPYSKSLWHDSLCTNRYSPTPPTKLGPRKNRKGVGCFTMFAAVSRWFS